MSIDYSARIPILPDEEDYMVSIMPPALLIGLRRYRVDHILPGGFLQAVLRNDLGEAICRADLQNLHALPLIVKFVFTSMPAPCWGSAEKVRAWVTPVVSLAAAEGASRNQETAGGE